MEENRGNVKKQICKHITKQHSFARTRCMRRRRMHIAKDYHSQSSPPPGILHIASDIPHTKHLHPANENYSQGGLSPI